MHCGSGKQIHLDVAAFASPTGLFSSEYSVQVMQSNNDSKSVEEHEMKASGKIKGPSRFAHGDKYDGSLFVRIKIECKNLIGKCEVKSRIEWSCVDSATGKSEPGAPDAVPAIMSNASTACVPYNLTMLGRQMFDVFGFYREIKGFALDLGLVKTNKYLWYPVAPGDYPDPNFTAGGPGKSSKTCPKGSQVRLNSSVWSSEEPFNIRIVKVRWITRPNLRPQLTFPDPFPNPSF